MNLKESLLSVLCLLPDVQKSTQHFNRIRTALSVGQRGAGVFPPFV
jgi:hypothetical protein